MKPCIPLLPPEGCLFVELGCRLARRDLQVILNVPDDPLDPAFFIRSSYCAGVDPKAVMPTEVHELGIKLEIRRSLDYHACQIVIPALAGYAGDLAESLDVAVQEELHGAAGIETNVHIPGVSEEKDEAVHHSGRDSPMHPVDLCFLAGKEHQFVKDLILPLFPVFLGMDSENRVTTRIPIGLQAVKHLLRLQVGMLLVPLLDQTLIGRKKALLGRLRDARPVDYSRDALLPHEKRLRNLSDR